MDYPLLFRLARTMQGKTQADIGLAGGVTPQAINIFEKHKGSLSARTIEKIAPNININPDYLSDPTANPFLSDDVIIMHLPENIFLPGIDFRLIYFLAEKNRTLEVVFLFSNTKFARRILRGTIAENPVIAIVCRDSDNNIFLFKRRKIMMGPVIGDRELRIELNKRRKTKTSIIIEDKEVDDKLIKLIRDEAVSHDELQELFVQRHDYTLSEDEWSIIVKKREKGIKDSEILRFLDSAPSD